MKRPPRAATPYAVESSRDIQRAANELLRQVSADRYGRVSPSVYETGRLVTLAPWLGGHADRVGFLLRTQRPDGDWGEPDGYATVPTLSAVEALLSILAVPEDSLPRGIDRGAVLAAAHRGLRALLDRSRAGSPVPDLIAVEVTVPCLIADINRDLDRFTTHPVPGFDPPPTHTRLDLPPGLDDTLLSRLRLAASQGQSLPAKLAHTLEALGEAASGAAFATPVDGAVGISPAATAAWLGAGPRPDHPSARYLDALRRRNGGPVPGVAPITVFERAWVLNSLARAGIDITVPNDLVAELRAHLSDQGAPAGAGVPADADDTAGALRALAKIGRPSPVDALFGYELDSYFCCFIGERTPSTTTNAHVLDVIRDQPHHDDQRARTINKIVDWLLGQQQPDGSWTDKWHASPYYATVCCAQALARTGSPGQAAARRARRWVRDTQRADGSWGRWTGTDEETAYAIQILLDTNPPEITDADARAAARGAEFLRRTEDGNHCPPLWHDKDLYAPHAVIQAARLAALHLALIHPPRANASALQPPTTTGSDRNRHFRANPPGPAATT